MLYMLAPKSAPLQFYHWSRFWLPFWNWSLAAPVFALALPVPIWAVQYWNWSQKYETGVPVLELDLVTITPKLEPVPYWHQFLFGIIPFEHWFQFGSRPYESHLRTEFCYEVR